MEVKLVASTNVLGTIGSAFHSPAVNPNIPANLSLVAICLFCIIVCKVFAGSLPNGEASFHAIVYNYLPPFHNARLGLLGSLEVTGYTLA
jgi:hypothetical protein